MTTPGLFIACGSTEPHYFAGITGAHKTLTVGVMSRASIERNHAGAMSTDSRGLRLSGNPVHEGVVSALDVLERNGARLLALNQLVVGGAAVAVWAGSPLQALEDAVVTVRDCFSHRLTEPVDIAIAAVGPPLNRDLYQADKGIKNVESVVRDGGILVVDAECSRGVGIDHFVALLKSAPDHATAQQLVEKRGYRLGDHKAVRLRALTDLRAVNVVLVSANVDPALAGVLGIRIFADRAAAAVWMTTFTQVPGLRSILVEDAGNATLELA
jgi:nickel-dependent lactate racemase